LNDKLFTYVLQHSHEEYFVIFCADAFFSLFLFTFFFSIEANHIGIIIYIYWITVFDSVLRLRMRAYIDTKHNWDRK